MINALELYKNIKSEWDKTSQPLKERGIPGQEFNPNGGFSGVKDEEYSVIFDPRNIRSTSAAFDPAMSDSANLLAANAPTASAVPLAGETQDTDPALLEYLRLTGQIPY